LAVLVKGLLIGLAMQRRLEPDIVSDGLAVRGLCALLGLTRDSVPPTTSKRSTTAATIEETKSGARP
jgi:hypothetical protein